MCSACVTPFPVGPGILPGTCAAHIDIFIILSGQLPSSCTIIVATYAEQICDPTTSQQTIRIKIKKPTSKKPFKIKMLRRSCKVTQPSIKITKQKMQNSELCITAFG